jgi:Acetoacetate decarboxylase (ADC)
MHLSIWSLPIAQVPRLPDSLAAVVRPVSVGGRALVGTAWVEYEPGGVLQYRELLSAVLIRHRARPRVSIVDIWVDSPASRDGGRELWGIPKDLAELRIDGSGAGGPGGLTASAQTETGTIAQTSITPGQRLPGRWPLGLSVIQQLGRQVKVTPVRGWANIQHAKATWQVERAGPLAELSGRRPVLTVTLRDFRIVFGRRPASR